MRSNAIVRFPILLLLGAVASFALAFALWPSFGDGSDPAMPPDARQGASQDGGGADGVGDGQGRKVVDGGPLRTGSFAAAVRITVVTSAGLPAADCEVRFGKTKVLRTDAAGVVETEVRPGRLFVEVKPPASAPNAQALVRTRVTATSGEVVQARIVLPASGGGEVWCRVVAAENKAPIEGAHVSVYPYGGAEGVTDADGLAVLQAEGDHEFLIAKTEGRALRRVLAHVDNFGEDGVLEVALPLAAELAVEVIGSDGEPIPAALVSLTAMSWTLMHPQRSSPRGEPETWTAETGEKGAASFVDLPPSSPLLVEVAPTDGKNGVFRETWTLTAGKNERRIELASLGGIRGRVLDAAGTPVPSARVAAVRLYGEEAMEYLPEDAHATSALTEADGTFSMPDLEPGVYALALQATRGWASKSIRVELAAGGSANAEIRAQAALSIRGTLTGPGNRPISAFEVHAKKGNAIVGSSVTDRDGAFCIESLVPGDYTITTELYDQALAMREPMVVPAGRSGVAVKVANVMGTLKGRVIGGDALRPDTFVRAHRRDGNEATAGRCDLDGRFEYGSIREGIWDLHVSDGDLRVGVVSGVRVVAQESTAELEIALMPGASLRAMHPGADKCVVLRGGEVIGVGPLERGLPTEIVVPPGKCVVAFCIRGREVGRVEANAVAGQHTVVEGR